jgi:hypothetical protein
MILISRSGGSGGPTSSETTADLSTTLLRSSGRDDKGEGGCGPDLMFTEGLHLGDGQWLLFSSYCPWKYRLPFVISTGAPNPDFLLRAASNGRVCGSL